MRLVFASLNDPSRPPPVIFNTSEILNIARWSEICLIGFTVTCIFEKNVIIFWTLE